jgi:type IV fimbrial biogenesis protein FimT
MAMTKQQYMVGFTLIELMVTLAVLAITLGIGVPMFRDTIARNNVVSEANRLVASINFARSQAVTKGQVVTLARLGATAQDWSDGWEVFTDTGRQGNESYVAADEKLKTFAPNAGQLSITSNAAAAQFVSFNARGMVVGGAGKSFAVCDSDGSSVTPGRVINIHKVGRPTVTRVDAANCSATADPDA